VHAGAPLTTIAFMNDTLRRFLPVAAVFAAAPAFACGPHLSHAHMSLLQLSMASAPLLAAFLVDRGAFALGAHAADVPRRHRPTVLGPIVAILALAIGLGGAANNHFTIATIGFSLVPVAAVICGLSFVRSVIIDQRGAPRAQLLRVGAVVGFSLLALARMAF
jgi:hypothetical protein